MNEIVLAFQPTEGTNGEPMKAGVGDQVRVKEENSSFYGWVGKVVVVDGPGYFSVGVQFTDPRQKPYVLFHPTDLTIMRRELRVEPLHGTRQGAVATLVFGRCPFCKWTGRGRDINHKYGDTRALAWQDSLNHQASKHPKRGKA